MAFVKASTQYKREHKADYGRERIEILYQDQWIVVINKPSGLLSVPYPGSQVRTAQSVLEEILRKQGTVNSHHKPYVVHRLDRDTSGVMMFALTEQAQKIIMDSWHQMVTERLYRAVSDSRIYFEDSKNNKNGKKSSRLLSDLGNNGLIDEPLAQNAHNVGFVPFPGDVDKDGKPFKTVPARTHYKKILTGPTHVLFELSLDTGKKNQIRAHLAAHGYPLAGDEEHRSHTDPFNRLCLHARTLEFNHPFTGEHLLFEVPEPAEWQEYVKKGDENPVPPVWLLSDSGKEHKNKPGSGGKQKNGKSQGKNSGSEDLKLGERRLSRKDQAHLGFIESGKRRR